MFDRDSFTIEEWGQIISAPAAIGSLVVIADLSGPLGLISEFRAIMNTMKEYTAANSANPLMGALQSYISTRPTKEEEDRLKEWAKEQEAAMKENRPETPEEFADRVHEIVDGVLEMLTAKGATAEDLSSYKNMMVVIAENVANASKEGGFLGFGGTLVSDAEESALARIRAELS
ncbi:MAG: DUF3631 domain-containing protein [Candidatus Promineofilum sp.]|nr:DUF3631 domain-containing protein [Promineifilum sp.]